ncbi:MAG: hypothetical protein M1834_002458 [Cirrosporium novae-zelandiae]|nr:MAG: hypothetical protein M1834_002458 [Cirrosporium novae-zelandiae]
MKSSIFSLVLSFTLFIGTFALPAKIARRDVSVVSVVSELYSNVQTYTGKINSTVSTLATSVHEVEINTGLASITADISEITSLIVAAKVQIKGLDDISATVDVKEVLEEVSELVAEIITEVEYTLEGVVEVFGLDKTLATLGGLVASLNGLLASLEVVVGSVLVTVGALLGGVLGGLTSILSGLIVIS